MRRTTRATPQSNCNRFGQASSSKGWVPLGFSLSKRLQRPCCSIVLRVRTEAAAVLAWKLLVACVACGSLLLFNGHHIRTLGSRLKLGLMNWLHQTVAWVVRWKRKSRAYNRQTRFQFHCTTKRAGGTEARASGL